MKSLARDERKAIQADPKPGAQQTVPWRENEKSRRPVRGHSCRKNKLKSRADSGKIFGVENLVAGAVLFKKGQTPGRALPKKRARRKTKARGEQAPAEKSPSGGKIRTEERKILGTWSWLQAAVKSELETDPRHELQTGAASGRRNPGAATKAGNQTLGRRTKQRAAARRTEN
jgi:hypothetical protein